MKRAKKVFCSLLVASIGLLPVQMARADVIATDQVIANSAAHGKRQAIATFLSRPEVVAQLASLGVPRAVAGERVAVMTDDEINALAGKLDSLPAAGGVSFVGVVAVLVFLLYWYIWAQTPAAAPAPSGR